MRKWLFRCLSSVFIALSVITVLWLWWASNDYDMPGDEYRTFLTGEVVSIEFRETLSSEAIVYMKEVKYSTDAAGKVHKYAYKRSVFFRNKEDVANVRIGDIITISGVENYPSFYNGKIEQIEAE